MSPTRISSLRRCNSFSRRSCATWRRSARTSSRSDGRAPRWRDLFRFDTGGDCNRPRSQKSNRNRPPQPCSYNEMVEACCTLGGDSTFGSAHCGPRRTSVARGEPNPQSAKIGSATVAALPDSRRIKRREHSSRFEPHAVPEAVPDASDDWPATTPAHDTLRTDNSARRRRATTSAEVTCPATTPARSSTPMRFHDGPTRARGVRAARTSEPIATSGSGAPEFPGVPHLRGIDATGSSGPHSIF